MSDSQLLLCGIYCFPCNSYHINKCLQETLLHFEWITVNSQLPNPVTAAASPVQVRKTVTTEWVSRNVSTCFSQYNTYVSIIPLTFKGEGFFPTFLTRLYNYCMSTKHMCLIPSTQHKALIKQAVWTEVINFIMSLFMSCTVIGWQYCPTSLDRNSCPDRWTQGHLLQYTNFIQR